MYTAFLNFELQFLVVYVLLYSSKPILKLQPPLPAYFPKSERFLKRKVCYETVYVIRSYLQACVLPVRSTNLTTALKITKKVYEGNGSHIFSLLSPNF